MLYPPILNHSTEHEREQYDDSFLYPSPLHDRRKTESNNATILNGQNCTDYAPMMTTQLAMTPADLATSAATLIPLTTIPQIDLVALKASICTMTPYIAPFPPL